MSGEELNKLDITPDEVKRFGEAMKKEEFRRLLADYAEEISNPENRKRYEDEIKQLENERGMDIKFINPEPGHVIKSVINEDKKKAFINICKNENIGKPTFTKESGGVRWSIPHSLTRPREDFDRSGEKCFVYDVVFHPDTYRMSESNTKFKKLVHDTALEAIEEHFGVSLDKNIRTPRLKNNYKGVRTSTVVRSRREGEVEPTRSDADSDGLLNNMPYPYDSNKSTEELSNEWVEKESRKRCSKRLAKARTKETSKTKTLTSESTSKEALPTKSARRTIAPETAPVPAETSTSNPEIPITPKYTILHRSALDLQEFRNAPDAKTSTRPKELVISIDLPMLKSANTIDLDIVENHVMLKCTTPVSYELDLRLPYPVDETNGTAKFDKSKSVLNVTLPVIPAQPEPLPFSSVHEGDFSSDNEADVDRGNSVDDGSEQCDSESPVLERDSDNQHSDDAVMNCQMGFDDDRINAFPIPALYQVPTFNHSQDYETITFIIDVANVLPSSIIRRHPEDNVYDLVFTCQGSGFFRLHYRLYVKFPDGCSLSPEDDILDVSHDNFVVLLLKDKDCSGLWEGFLVGSDENNFEYYNFDSISQLQQSLEELESGFDPGCTMPQAQDTDYHLNVTDLNEKHVTLDVQVGRSVSESDTTDTEPSAYPNIEVVHRKRLPNLQGILKQRSKTMSESSDDNVILSASPDSSSGECPFSAVKKSVSFNEHIDQATFKTNSTVTSMRSMLKSKRKRTRQREERKKNGRRRRRNSSQESSEGEDFGKKDAAESCSKSQSKGQQGKGSKKKNSASGSRGGVKQEGASSSTVEETDETTNTEGSDHDSDSGYDNNGQATRDSSQPEEPPSQSKNNDLDHYNFRSRRNPTPKSSEPKNEGTKNCCSSLEVMELGSSRNDNGLTTAEKTKLDHILTAAVGQTLLPIVDDSETSEVPDSPDADTGEMSKVHIDDTLTHMAGLSIKDGTCHSNFDNVHRVLEPNVNDLDVNGIADGDESSDSFHDFCETTAVTTITVESSSDGEDSQSISIPESDLIPNDDSKPNGTIKECEQTAPNVAVTKIDQQDHPKGPSKGNGHLVDVSKLKGSNSDSKSSDDCVLGPLNNSCHIDTVLSWGDTHTTNLQNEHRTHCPFQFNNNILFELD